MLPFSFSGKGDKASVDLEQELDRFVESGMEKMQAALRSATVPGQHEGKKAQAAAEQKTPAAPASKPKKRKPSAWSVKPHISKKGVKGRIIKVGPFSCWLPDGDADKCKAVLEAINVFRSQEAHRMWEAVKES